MPQLGLGTCKPGGSNDLGVTQEEGRARLVRAVLEAMRSGYRLLDTTLSSGTEAHVMEGVRQSGVARSEVFVATKLVQSAHRSDDGVRRSLEESLANLGTDFVDLYMIHNPRAGRILRVWPLLTELRDQGHIRALGVSNFGVEQLESMRLAGLELPEVNQVEVHCWRQWPELVEYHRRHDIVTMCMVPLSRGEMLNRTDLTVLAHGLGRPEASVAIRWALQKGFVAIPRSVRPERIRLNAAVDFELTQEMMARIERLDEDHVVARLAATGAALPWEHIADSVPDKSAWDPRYLRQAQAAAKRERKKAERARRALAKQEEQMRARAAVAAQRRARQEE